MIVIVASGLELGQIMMTQSNSNQRREHRSAVIFPVFVHVKSIGGQAVKATTLTDNLSQDGAFLQLPHLLGRGTFLFVFVHLSGSVRLAATGSVVRIENKNNGLMGIAVCFKNTRLLPILAVPIIKS